jgi:anti-sigma B factor antagonist
MSVSVESRQNGDVTIVDLVGRVTLGEATGKLRDAVRGIIAKGNKKILLNLVGVSYIDSAGLGELVSAYTTVTNQGGQLKLLNVADRVHDLMQVTKLVTIFEVYQNESIAVLSFG